MPKPIVGILSMQRVINYGSYLQAYALRELLKDDGAGELYFIDIIPGRILVNDAIAKQHKYVRYAAKLWHLAKSSHLISGIKTFLFNRKLTRSIQAAWPVLGLNKQASDTLDLLVIGSDEVFNCCQDVHWGYSTQLFGDIPASVARRVASYAGSFGYTDLDKLEFYGIDTEIAGHLKKLSAISVRDENSASIIKCLIGKEPLIHVDPVLAYGFQKELKSFTERPMTVPYMIVYSYQGRINSPKEIDEIKKWAQSNGLKTISIFCRYDWCDEAVLPANPIEVLRWFKFADCVVTDTFHGTIFSVIAQARFATLLRESNYNKLHYLLQSLGLLNRVADETHSVMEILSSKMDYGECCLKLEEVRHQTNVYLKRLMSLTDNDALKTTDITSVRFD